MNAKKSLVWWIIGCVIFAGGVWSFAHGAQLTDTDATAGALWIVGSLALMALTVFGAVKLNTRK